MTAASGATAKAVAEWMLAELDRQQYLYQEVVVHEISRQFGDSFTYINDSGGWSIDKRVLSAFNKLTGDAVVWERGERLWRRRHIYDSPGRLQS